MVEGSERRPANVLPPFARENFDEAQDFTGPSGAPCRLAPGDAGTLSEEFGYPPTLPNASEHTLTDCRAFRRNHVGYVDDTLPGEVVGRMDHHRSVCTTCAAMDTRVRRGLLIFRNHSDGIQISSDFGDRLAARLEAERERPAAAIGYARYHGVFFAAAVALVAIGIAASVELSPSSTSPMAGQLAVLPEQRTVPTLVTSQPSAPPAFVASVSMGMAILPALMLSEELHAAGGTQSEWLQSAAWSPQAEER